MVCLSRCIRTAVATAVQRLRPCLEMIRTREPKSRCHAAKKKYMQLELVWRLNRKRREWCEFNKVNLMFKWSFLKLALLKGEWRAILSQEWPSDCQLQHGHNLPMKLQILSKWGNKSEKTDSDRGIIRTFWFSSWDLIQKGNVQWPVSSQRSHFERSNLALLLLVVALCDADHSLDFKVFQNLQICTLLLVTHIKLPCYDLYWVDLQVFKLL